MTSEAYNTDIIKCTHLASIAYFIIHNYFLTMLLVGHELSPQRMTIEEGC